MIGLVGIRKLWWTTPFGNSSRLLCLSGLMSCIHISEEVCHVIHIGRPAACFLSILHSFHSNYASKMHLPNFIFALSLLTTSCSALPSHFKRDISTNVTLYAYGTNITGLTLYYGNTDGIPLPLFPQWSQFPNTSDPPSHPRLFSVPLLHPSHIYQD